MKKNISKRFLAMLLAMLVAVGTLPMTVGAAPTIDMDATGSITIIKEIKGDDGDQPDTRLEDVIFYQLKVGDIAQVKNPAGEVVVAYTNVNPGFLNLLGWSTTGHDFALNSGADRYFYASTLQNRINALFTTTASQAALRTWIMDNTPVTGGNGTAMAPTDTTGTTVATGLPVGLYLFVETDYPALVKGPCVPFLISMPSNVTVDPSDWNAVTEKYEETKDVNNWLYNVTAIPKNELDEIEVDKWILNNNGNDSMNPADHTTSKGEDYQIGDTVPYIINADVPASILNLFTYKIGDYLSPGLTYAGVNRVYAELSDGRRVALVEGTHYDLFDDPTDLPAYTDEQMQIINHAAGAVVDDSTFVVKFKPATLTFPGINPGDPAGIARRVYIEYDAILNEDAEIYTDGNPNYVTLEYSKTTGTDESTDDTEKVKPKTPEPVVYTYKVKVTKTLEGVTLPADISPFTGIAFELRDLNGVKIPVRHIGNNQYVVVNDAATPPNPADDRIEVDANGVAEIIGLNAGQYQLVEIQTVPGYTLLKEPIIINIHAKFVGETFVANPAGDYFQYDSAKKYYLGAKEIDMTGFANGTYVEMPGVVREGPLATDTLVAKFDHATGTGGSVHDGTITSNHDVINGVIEFIVANKKGFDLPSTGGMGTYIFTIGGIALIAAALLLISKKKKLKSN